MFFMTLFFSKSLVYKKEMHFGKKKYLNAFLFYVKMKSISLQKLFHLIVRMDLMFL